MNDISSIASRLAGVAGKIAPEGYGLREGKCGLAVLHYIISGITDSDYHQQQAMILFDEIVANVDKITNTGFAEGLAGIGWAIEWLAQSGYLQEDTDLILGELDEHLRHIIVHKSNVDISFGKGAIGLAVYFLKRMESSLNRVSLEECLILLSDDIYTRISEPHGEAITLEEAGDAFLLALKLRSNKINVWVCNRIIMHYISRICPPDKKKDPNMLMRNAFICLQASRDVKYSFLRDIGEAFLTAALEQQSPKEGLYYFQLLVCLRRKYPDMVPAKFNLAGLFPEDYQVIHLSALIALTYPQLPHWYEQILFPC